MIKKIINQIFHGKIQTLKFSDIQNDENKVYNIDFQDNGKIKPDSKMGYISNVKDARKKLESDFKLRPDHKQS